MVLYRAVAPRSGGGLYWEGQSQSSGERVLWGFGPLVVVAFTTGGRVRALGGCHPSGAAVTHGTSAGACTSALQVLLRELPPGRPGGAASSPALGPGPHTARKAAAHPGTDQRHLLDKIPAPQGPGRGPGLHAEEAAGPGAGHDAGVAAAARRGAARGPAAGGRHPPLPSVPQPPGVPAHELSIHRLDWMALALHRAFLTVCQASGFPLCKAPEYPLPHMAELKKELLALRAQLGYKNRALASLQQRQGSPGTNAQALVQGPAGP
ncbi:uncharacterized protein LOC115640593 [Gopherus evgoodei]|uniref:uncharacterized protein LOC115640593 n=1 Tax=Gopherus evgoodei TaxID=1825980 RepID=UPI0011CFD875|nr:uncharacterized protein LOC115640593 [Gopherus evgoodei]XP_030399332.1 uncharacterized protein LOC115640593 [Gopherus evgoodei]